MAEAGRNVAVGPEQIGCIRRGVIALCDKARGIGKPALATNADILGTIGGDDTILIVCRSNLARDRVVRRLKTLAGEPQ